MQETILNIQNSEKPHTPCVQVEHIVIPRNDTYVRDAIVTDFNYIDSLRKREGSALGFIPKNAYLSVLSGAPVDGRRRYEYSKIYVTVDNEDLTGFVYATFAGMFAHIHQIVVQEDARRWYRASLLETKIDTDAKKYNKQGIECRVAFDLESNYYWRAMGYIPMKQIVSTWLNQRESKSKRPLWHYRKDYGLPLAV